MHDHRGADVQGRSRGLATWPAEEFGVVTAGVYGSSEVFALAATWPLDEPVPDRWAGGGRGVEGELEFRGPNVAEALRARARNVGS